MNVKDGEIFAVRVQNNEDVKDYMTVLPLEFVAQYGLMTEAIIGVLLTPADEHTKITPQNFATNADFQKFMHDVISRHGPEEADLKAEAKRVGNGWVYMLDGRCNRTDGSVPHEDIIGAFKAVNGEVEEGSYSAGPKYMLLSDHGFFRLNSTLHNQLVQELMDKVRK